MSENEIMTIEVNKESLINAAESHCNLVQKQAWQFFHGLYCIEFFNTDDRPGVNDFSGYDEYLKYCQLSDTDDNYSSYIQSVKDHWENNLLSEIWTEEPDNEGNPQFIQKAKVIYV